MMRPVLAWTAWMVAGAWAWKAATAFFGLRRLPDLCRAEFSKDGGAPPRLAVIVPARNEEATLRPAMQSLLAQVYPGLHVVAIDDRSADTTGALLDELASSRGDRLSVLHVRELPQGWLGKTHAMALGARHAQTADDPEWLLFTDADVLFAPDALLRAARAAQQLRADHFVTLPTPILESFSEGMLMGFFPVLALWGVRPWKVADPRARDAIGVGAFNLIRTPVYHAIGGFDAMRLAIVEDLTLGGRVKRAGYQQRVGVGLDLVRIHWAPGATGIVRVMTKNLFAVLRYNVLLAVGAAGGLVLLAMLPLLGLFWAGTRAPAALTSVSIAVLYGLSARHNRIPAAFFVFYPVAALLFAYSIALSAITTLRQGGVEWRGTFYPLRELRRHLDD